MRIMSSLRMLPLVLLAACGSGTDDDGDNPPLTDASPGGYYTGSFIENGTAFDVEGLVTEDGTAILVSEAGYYVMDMETAGEALDGNFTAYVYETPTANEQTVITGTISATVTERDSIIGTYTLDGQDGTLALVYQDEYYETGASPAAILGTWGDPGGNTISITFSQNGTLFGQDADNCVYNGSWSIPDAAYNGYRFTELSINCGAGAVTWSGSALIINDVMGLFIYSAAEAASGTFARM